MNTNCITRVGTAMPNLDTGNNKITFNTNYGVNHEVYFYEGFLYAIFYGMELPNGTTSQAIFIQQPWSGEDIPVVHGDGSPVLISEVKLNKDYIYRVASNPYRLVLVRRPAN